MLLVTLKRIEHAIAAYDHAGVTAAARALNVSQPSLTVSISQLESELGCPLFIRRKGHEIKPTSFGRSFFREAKILIRQANALMASAKPHTEISGNITFGCFEDLAPFHLANIVARMSLEYPGIVVNCSVSGFDTLASRLIQGTIDVVLTYDLGLSSQVERIPVSSTKPYALVAKAHRFASLSSITLKELASEPLILTSQTFSWQHMLTLFNAQDLEPVVGFKASSIELQRSFVGNGLGVAISYARPFALESYDGKPLHMLEIDDELPTQRILLAHAKNNPPSEAVTYLIELVQKVINTGNLVG
jgi:DNA-binding transcriptional LysR family regulator